jgi:predicted DNA-binding transcriptional regulator AlpA
MSANVTTGEHTDPDQMLTAHEVASILRLSVPTLSEWRSSGIGPTFKRLGHRTIRYRREDVLAWIDSHQDH